MEDTEEFSDSSEITEAEDLESYVRIVDVILDQNIPTDSKYNILSLNITSIQRYEYAKTKFKIDYCALFIILINRSDLTLCKHIILENVYDKPELGIILNSLNGPDSIDNYSNNDVFNYLTSVYYGDV